MNCTRCSHRDDQHGQDGRCRVIIAYAWDERKRQFNGLAPCLCPALRLPPPKPDLSHCPHEYVKTSDRCVICHHARVAR